ncbi:MAG TPA: DHH family phosphoesterase [Candidatus Pacearchaeota archaeon]|nr:DHH family phosphoesterase [Candidatus Pacearchaeota archaeon]HOK94394.1 DHH family phosphoesterase [Candidatus Pacearchaeota archaeon]HPO75267.1 DHH family phosphoesterase [Candidatus Pacearchaeota archaeon]
MALIGVVEKIIQTGGPTVFEINDGTGNLSLKGFIAPGQRAYPEIQEGEYIKAIVTLEEFNGEIEGDIQRIFKKSDEEKIKIKKEIEGRQRERAKVTPLNFLVNDPILIKLKNKFINAATEIRLAILQGKPIIIRHHCDTDGYSAAFALERAILPLIKKQHMSEKAPWEFFMRAPSMSPYYEIDDSIRDTASSLRNVAKFSNKMPLIIIVDNGSAEANLMAIKQGKVHGEKFIVIDHHQYDKDFISDEVIEHINPFLVEEQGTKTSAGILCTELARFVNPEVKNIEQIPALAALADRVDLENPTSVEKYVEIAEREGYSKELLKDISLVIEYVSSKIRFMEAREYIEVLFGEPRDKQKELINLMAPYIKELDEKGLKMGKANAKIEKINDITLQLVYIEETYPGFGFFPKPGRSIGLLHDDLQTEKKLDKVISIGIMETSMTFRATDKSNFSIHELINFLNEKIPDAFIEGGGHKNAGSIKFLPNKKEKVLALVKEFIKKS